MTRHIARGVSVLVACLTLLPGKPLFADDATFLSQIGTSPLFGGLKSASAKIPDWVAETGPMMTVRLSSPVHASRSAKASVPLADGTWREEGRYVIIKLNGQELKLVKEPTSQHEGDREHVPTSPIGRAVFSTQSEVKTGGRVSGRLLNRSRPLVNCRISLVPLQRSGFGGYSVNGAGEPQTAVTDDRGEYRFEDIPHGRYKLFWLPQGHRRWIRRIEFRPDVVIKGAETVELKPIRVALQTVN